MNKIEALWINAYDRTLYFKKYNQDFDFTPYKDYIASQYLNISYQKEIIVYQKIDELSIFIFGNKQANELYLVEALHALERSLRQLYQVCVCEDSIVMDYLNFSTMISETIDNGAILTDIAPEIFKKEESGGIVSGVIGGVKFLAKTILQ